MGTGRFFLLLFLLVAAIGTIFIWALKTKSQKRSDLVFVVFLLVASFAVGIIGLSMESYDNGYASARVSLPQDRDNAALDLNEVYWKVASVQLQAGEWIAIIQTRDGEKMYYSFPADIPPVFIRKTGVDGKPLYEPIATAAVSGERNPEEPAVSPKTP